jgi:four helix bundle protein
MFKFEKLTVWQRAVAFADMVYDISRSFPTDERFGLTNQIRRASVSISSNIAEGSARPDADFAKFIGYATGSLYEVVTQGHIAKNQNLLSEEAYVRFHAEAEEISRMLSGLRRSLGDTHSIPSSQL